MSDTLSQLATTNKLLVSTFSRSKPKGLPARPEDGLPSGRNSSAARAFMLTEAARPLEPGRAGLRGERGSCGWWEARLVGETLAALRSTKERARKLPRSRTAVRICG